MVNYAKEQHKNKIKLTKNIKKYIIAFFKRIIIT